MTDPMRTINHADAEALFARHDPNRELPPGADGYVLEDNGTEIGYVAIDTNDKTLTFHWISASAAWPATFEMVASSGTTPSTNVKDIYEHTTFPTNTTSVDLSTCQYKIVQGGSIIGYLNKRTDGIDWHSTSSAPAGGYFSVGAMTFKANTDTGTTSAHHIDDLKL